MLPQIYRPTTPELRELRFDSVGRAPDAHASALSMSAVLIAVDAPAIACA